MILGLEGVEPPPTPPLKPSVLSDLAAAIFQICTRLIGFVCRVSG
jgi:hypothetical protein